MIKVNEAQTPKPGVVGFRAYRAPAIKSQLSSLREAWNLLNSRAWYVTNPKAARSAERAARLIARQIDVIEREHNLHFCSFTPEYLGHQF